MTKLIGLALEPFAMVFRLSFAHPIIAIAISTAAGLIALATGHEHWMAVMLSFAAYVLIAWDEIEYRATLPPLNAAPVE